MSRFGVIAILILAAIMATASSSWAAQIPGAAYSGTHAGGGTVSLTVSSDGSAVTSFSATDVPGNVCTFGSFSSNFNAPIVDRKVVRSSSTFGLNGEFGSAQGVSGTFVIVSGGCTTGNVSFTATTTSPPPPQCSDFEDNDRDGRTDFPNDPGCTSAADIDETDPAATPPPTTPTTPTTPSTPTAPGLDTVAPVIALSGASVQKAGSSIAVVLSCPGEACKVSVSGTVSVPGASKVYRLTPASATLLQGARRTLKVKVSRTAQKAIKRALVRHRKVKAKLTVTVRDAAGNKSVKVRTVTLKR